MKARSPKLAQYLEETGALDGTPEDIARAKIEYRKQYKAAHKKRGAGKHRELRPQFSFAEYGTIKHKAEALGLAPTAYVKAVALKYDTGVLPEREALLRVFQTLSMAAILLERDGHPTAASLCDAEKWLTDYLKKR
jgi:hypothetical protein